jgi:hypothetical protein
MNQFVYNIVSVVFAIGGIVLAAMSKEGWGWCFFIAAACHRS